MIELLTGLSLWMSGGVIGFVTFSYYDYSEQSYLTVGGILGNLALAAFLGPVSSVVGTAAMIYLVVKRFDTSWVKKKVFVKKGK